MSAAADIILADGAGSPVNHTFNPVKVADDVVIYNDKVTGVMSGYPKLSLSNRLPDSSNPNYKCTITLSVPTLETAATAASGFTPGPTVAYTSSFKVEFVIPGRSTQAERDNIYAFAKNALAHATIAALVKTMDIPY
jgi:hypothetical protein